MKQAQHIDTLWPYRTIIGEADAPTMYTDRCIIRLKYDRSEEEYRFREELLFPLLSRSGQRIYFGAKPYILIPNITLTFVSTPPQADSNTIGRVVDSDVTQLQELELGNAQAWYYPTEKAVVLWECYLHQPYRQQDLLSDSLVATVWQGFEKILRRQFPDTERIYSTYEDIYQRPVWEQFLTTQGYRKVENVTFVKEVEK